MAPACRLMVEGRPVPAAWRREGGAIVVSPEGGAPLAVSLAAVGGIAGDGFAIALREGDRTIALERLGADGRALLADLRRDWPPLRASALRLADEASPRLFAGSWSAAGEPASPFVGFFSGDLLLLAPEGADLQPLFLSRLASIGFDEESHVVVAAGWDGTRTLFSRLAGDTEPFRGAIAAARERLAARAAAVVARFLPTLAPEARAALSARWLPGRFLALAELERLAPGLRGAFAASWLAGSPRAAEGTHLLAAADDAAVLLGYGPGAGEEAPLLALLARRGGRWVWETLSEEDFATYRFRDDPALPALAEGMLALPQFSREALYLPLAELAGDRGDLAAAARELPFLRALRAAFLGRVIHASPERWRAEVDA